MYARVRELLTLEERLQYLQIPPDLGEWELGTYFTFTQHDLEIIQQWRREYNRLGFAVQLCVLRYLGWRGPLITTIWTYWKRNSMRSGNTRQRC
ncbi:DUF4158 domain-containing protein [Paenibacillus sp. MZ04-78.2]|uniref:DUF4158 domain-containing protein n=1 Tax=Paenibacillus sp. MZ04-78.2 TaxID=2962034 RepID=UPI0020B8021B|nr:DUF4158 domain-containing protein [Paenibacillus sp. MZ04-78.2]MCP3774837.1 DUF4158 domain-containing protein [Paenibacillus sp. MZ04-78.2]